MAGPSGAGWDERRFRVIRAGLVDEVTFEQVLKARRESVMWISGKHVSGRGNSPCKGPRMRLYLLCSRNSQGAGVAAAERGEGLGEKKIIEVGGYHIIDGFLGHAKDLAFTLNEMETTGLLGDHIVYLGDPLCCC